MAMKDRFDTVLGCCGLQEHEPLFDALRFRVDVLGEAHLADILVRNFRDCSCYKAVSELLIVELVCGLLAFALVRVVGFNSRSGFV